MPQQNAKTRKTPARPTKPTAPVASKQAAVPSTIGSLFQALKTARLEIPEVETAASAHPDTRQDNLVHHLATILHGAYLVTLVERAQLGTPVLERVRGGVVTTAAAATDASVAEQRPEIPVASTTVDARWLSALVQYCRFTVVLDDLAKLAEAFPSYVSVRWSLKATRAPVSATLAAALGDQAATRSPSRTSPGRRRPRTSNAAHSEGSLGAGALVARLSVYQSTVPAVDEAVSALEGTLKAKGAAAAQRAWRTHLSQLTAYGAFLRQHPLSTAATTDAQAAEDKAARGGSPSRTHAATDSAVGDAMTKQELTEEEHALLSQLSPELRNALSRRKLRGVLTEMKREQDRADSKEDEEIKKRQIRERLLVTYEHVLALCGPKRRTFGASNLLRTLESESLLPEHRHTLAQLALLVGIRGSGISASTVTTDGVTPVVNFAHLSHDELDAVLVTVDPESGSVQGIVQSLSQQPG